MNPHVGVLLPIFFILSLMGATFREKWVFDSEKREVSSVFSLFFISRSRRFSFDKVEYFEVNSFIKGAPVKGGEKVVKRMPFKTEFSFFSVYLSSGDKYTIETVRNRAFQPLKEKAQSIEDFTGLKLIFEGKSLYDEDRKPKDEEESES